MTDKRKLLALSHHRNGICGEPFNVALFTEDGRTMLAVHFDGPGHNTGNNAQTAVFDVDKLAEHDIEFMSNSWRGDHYSDWMREQAKARGEG